MSHIKQFCESIIAKDDGTSPLENDHFEAMKASIVHTSDSSTLLPLLHHQNDWVVCWTASHLLAKDKTSNVINALRGLVQKGGIASFSAETVIQEYEQGCFVSPFS